MRELEEPYLVRTDPYAESKPVLDPQWFYGRGELLQRLPGVLTQGQHVGIFGLRKIGKTSLINQLRQRFIATPTVFIDCQALTNKAESYFAEILQQLHKQLTMQGTKKLPSPPSPSTADAEQFRQQVLAYFEAWQDAGRRELFVLIFDEIDKFFPRREAKDSEEILTEYMRCFRILRGLAQTRQCVVLLVIASRPDVNRHNQLTDRIGENPMFRSFQEEYLGFLNADDSTRMIEEIGTWQDIVWEHDAAQRVFTYCGGHPLVTRFFASEASEEGSRKQIDLARVEEVAGDQQKTFRKNDIGNYYQEGVWDLLREEERQVLSEAPDGTLQVREIRQTIEDTLAPQVDNALTILSYHGVIDDSDPDEPRIAGTMFSDWYRNNAPRQEQPPSTPRQPEPPRTQAIRLFYSYSHKDEKFREKLETHLALLKRQKIIDTWQDRQITAGQEWRVQIHEHLEAADIILLLISADFLASDFCYDQEMT
ncbi:MAG: TIR domain-containing protein [Candidatus Binatia bacterium]